MGVAWHRFLAFFNIWLKREASGRTALGALRPMMVDGQPIDFEAIEDLDEDATLGVATITDFTWKGLLDFTTCTECGRCQSQCPAWNTEKPLSPKLLVMGLRDHAYAQAPYLTAAGAGGERDAPSRARSRSTSRWCHASAASSTPTSCGPARPAAPASSSARSTSSTSTTSSTCAATRC